MRDKEIGILMLVAGLLFIWAFAATVVAIESNYEWRKESVKRGHAEYNAQTGDWQWKESEATR